MNCEVLAKFLDEHPDWSPVLYVYGKQDERLVWEMGFVGLEGPGGRFFNFRAVEKVMRG